jgi:putative tricarboxylic transport membrane protein
VIVYCIVALILLWPLVRRILPRKAVPSVLEEAAHEVEEAHQHHGLTSAVSVERHTGDHVGDEARKKPDFGEPSGP